MNFETCGHKLESEVSKLTKWDGPIAEKAKLLDVKIFVSIISEGGKLCVAWWRMGRGVAAGEASMMLEGRR